MSHHQKERDAPRVLAKEKTYTVEFTFHSGKNLPVADINTLSCDPYVHAELDVPTLPLTHDEPALSWRTPTVRRTRDPTWDCQWRVSGIPTSGCTLILKVKDEDPGDRDDRLGKGYLDLTNGNLSTEFEIKEREVVIQKRKGSFVPYITTYLTAAIPGQKLRLHPRIVVSVKVIGEDDKKPPNKAYTVGPNKYSQHFSPLIGRMVSSSTGGAKEDEDSGEKSSAKSSSFVANKLQLTGPPPASLRHPYVPYRAFIGWLFQRSGVIGRLLNISLHKQYRTLYSYDKQTVYGVIEPSHHPITTDGERRDLSHNMAVQFLKMSHFGTGARIFTYVMTLDGEWRFCETGKEFAIDLLSKHSMHADLAKVIAFSGEFFVRKLENPEGDTSTDTGQTEVDSTSKVDDEDPKSYELIIDNDSGTYRPKKELLPTLQEWLASPSVLGGLGNVRAMDGFDETLKKWKDERKEQKKKLKESSGKQPKQVKLARSGSSVLSVNSRELGGGGSIGSQEVAAAVHEQGSEATAT